MKYILMYAWALWIGIGTTWLLKASMKDWKWWVFIVVLCALVCIGKEDR